MKYVIKCNNCGTTVTYYLEKGAQVTSERLKVLVRGSSFVEYEGGFLCSSCNSKKQEKVEAHDAKARNVSET